MRLNSKFPGKQFVETKRLQIDKTWNFNVFNISVSKICENPDVQTEISATFIWKIFLKFGKSINLSDLMSR